MKHTDYITSCKWFAWRPVKTSNGWVWLKSVNKTTDDRPLVYQGLLTKYYYEKNKLKN